MTGTPLDLTPFGPLLKALGLLYWALALAVAGLALWLPKSWWLKLPLAALVLAAFIVPVAGHVQQQGAQRDAAQERLDASMALFQERCKTAGERITRTVENVEGVVWMKWRDQEVNYQDQFKLDDPYGADCGLEGCIVLLLKSKDAASRFPESAKRHAGRYDYVQSIDPEDGRPYQYTGHPKSVKEESPEEFSRYVRSTGIGAEPDGSYLALKKTLLVNGLTARYGVTWDDISTREDREHWIAGSSLKVLDLRTNEVIAERIGYMIDRGQGSQAGFRSPWGYANETACPEKIDVAGNRTQVGFTARFVNKVLNATRD